MSQLPDRTIAGQNGALSVLIVDDEPTLRLGFTYALSNHLTKVETAANGRDALDRIAEMHFDIMILDLRMPELDGIGVIQALREAGNPLPVILCSAALTPAAALSAIRHRVVDFLLKPVRPSDLRQIIDFVRQPGREPLALALQAARTGRHEDAIGILENDLASTTRSRCWLGLFKAIRDNQADDDCFHLTDKIRTSLTTIAFNAPVSS